jgi:hypothetical protein
MSALTAPKIMHSIDFGAPAITNTVGDLTTALDVLLVKGYPTQSLTTLTYAAGVVSVAKTAHGYAVNDLLTISGANEDGYNGNQTVATVADADHFTYAVTTTPATPATGTIIGSNRPSQSITTLVSSGLTATATKTSHGYTSNQMIKISGANESAYNGNFKITVVDANNFTYVMLTDPVNTATGTITASYGQLGLGWELQFTGTNIRSYRPRQGTRMSLGVEHNTNAYNAHVRGFESMTAAGAVATAGAGPYPTDAQVSGGDWVQVTINTAGARPWALWGDDKGFYMGIEVDATANAIWNYWHFGDFDSFKPGDLYNSQIIGKAVSVTTSASDNFPTLSTASATVPMWNAAALTGHYCPRAYTAAGGSLGMGKAAENLRRGGLVMGSHNNVATMLTYPDTISGSLHVARMYVLEPGVGVRGVHRGLWDLMHNVGTMAGVADGNIFSGLTGLSGLDFELRKMGSANPSPGCVFETSDTW